MRPPAVERLQRAGALQREGRHRQALPLLQQSVSIDPQHPILWEALGACLKDCGHYQQAVESFDKSLQLSHPRPHEIQLHRAVIFADHLRRDDAARSALEAALALRQDYLPALLNLGNFYEQQGARAEAMAVYTRALEDPRFAQGPFAPLLGVARARMLVMRPPTSPEDPAIEEARAAVRAAQDPTVKVHLLFALGQSLDRLEMPEQAFAAFSEGNSTLKNIHGRHYDRARERRLNDHLMQVFARRTTEVTHGESGAAPVRPLFICGMFRSGSTLLEQVLSSHPGVVAGGEVDWLLRLAAERMAPFPASAMSLSSERAADLGREYLRELQRLFPEARPDQYVTDKRPDNFQIIGLIKRLLPDAKIINTIRHPVDVGLSVFMQHMNTEVTPYATDLGDIGHYYGEYRRLMAHWKTLYPESIHDFSYDAFVRDPESELRPVLKFLGLPWADECLDFHTKRNTVKTASYWQVRQPLYSGASGRWTKYLPMLAPLLDSLAAAGIQAD